LRERKREREREREERNERGVSDLLSWTREGGGKEGVFATRRRREGGYVPPSKQGGRICLEGEKEREREREKEVY
jgi:hypothetical protein